MPLDWSEFLQHVTSCFNSAFSLSMLDAIEKSGPSPKHLPLIDAAVLYGLVRTLRPQIILEVGTFRGMSASFMRQAQIDSNIADACIFTIDHEPNHQLGLIIPDSLRAGIHQIIGDIRDPSIKGSIPSHLDMYFHDSNHRYSFQEWEYATFWSSLNPGGLLVSHDVDKSGAFSTFVGSAYVHNSEGYAENTTRHEVWGRIGKIGFAVKK